MKKKILSFILAAAMTMSLPLAASAAELTTDTTLEPIGSSIEEGGVSVMSVASSNIGTSRLSSTSGKITAYATFTDTATRAVCTIYLQEKYNGSWRTATGLGTTSYTKTAYNTNSISAGKTFTLISGKVYRGKIVFTDVIDGVISTKTRYTGSF